MSYILVLSGKTWAEKYLLLDDEKSLATTTYYLRVDGTVRWTPICKSTLDRWLQEGEELIRVNTEEELIEAYKIYSLLLGE